MRRDRHAAPAEPEVETGGAVGFLPILHPYGVCEALSSKSRRDGMSVETGITTFGGKGIWLLRSRIGGWVSVFYRCCTPTGFKECQLRSPGGSGGRRFSTDIAPLRGLRSANFEVPAGRAGVGLLPTSHPYGVCGVPISKSRRDDMSVETGYYNVRRKRNTAPAEPEMGGRRFATDIAPLRGFIIANFKVPEGRHIGRSELQHSPGFMRNRRWAGVGLLPTSHPCEGS